MTDSTAEARLAALPDTLPPPGKPGTNRQPAVRTGNLVYLSGHGPAPGADGVVPAGKVGPGGRYTEAEGAQIARSVGLALLSSLREAVGSLDRVTRVVKVLGMVNCPPEFTTQHKVIDGCSDLFVEVFGQAIGRHARSAVGMGSLPLDFPVEIEAIFEVEEGTAS
jgi:enamine deaminase RidA (YjgF/YER057c/UK114 family)